MLKQLRSKHYAVLSVLALVSCTAGGCGGLGAGSTSTAPAAAGQKEPLVQFFAAPRQSGAALWAANCNRCHNAVGPSTFRPDEWDLVVNHMRLRANLTGPEARAIADYLKSGS
jgi:cytochrome c553